MKKIIITLSLSWLLIVGYLTWYNGLKASGRYKGFNWEEWLWFGLIPLLLYIFYFIWKPEAFKDLVKDINHYLIKMEIIVFTPNLEIVYQKGLFFLNYIIEQVIEITAQIKFNLLLNNFFFIYYWRSNW